MGIHMLSPSLPATMYESGMNILSAYLSGIDLNDPATVDVLLSTRPSLEGEEKKLFPGLLRLASHGVRSGVITSARSRNVLVQCLLVGAEAGSPSSSFMRMFVHGDLIPSSQCRLMFVLLHVAPWLGTTCCVPEAAAAAAAVASELEEGEDEVVEDEEDELMLLRAENQVCALLDACKKVHWPAMDELLVHRHELIQVERKRRGIDRRLKKHREKILQSERRTMQQRSGGDVMTFVEKDSGVWSNQRQELTTWCNDVLDEITDCMRVMLVNSGSSEELCHFVMLCSTEVGRNVIGYNSEGEDVTTERRMGRRRRRHGKTAEVEIQCCGLRALDQMVDVLVTTNWPEKTVDTLIASSLSFVERTTTMRSTLEGGDDEEKRKIEAGRKHAWSIISSLSSCTCVS